MPTYEYACRDCGEHIEVVQSFKDDPLTTCGICGGALRKVFSAAGIIFKGSGYYVTDSRKSSAAPSADKQADKQADKPAPADDSKPAASKSDSSSPAAKKAESA